MVTAFASSDWVVGGSGAANLTALAGNDTIFGGSGPDQIDTGNANITVVGGAGAATVNAGITTTTFIGSGAEVFNCPGGGITSTGSGSCYLVAGYRPGTDVINLVSPELSRGFVAFGYTPIGPVFTNGVYTMNFSAGGSLTVYEAAT